MSYGFQRNNNSIKEKEASKQLLPQEDFTHSFCWGSTGSGKTVGYVYPLLQDRIQKDYGVLFIDYKGKEHRVAKYFAKEAGRLDDVIEMGVPWGIKINLLQSLNEKGLMGLLSRLIMRDDMWSKKAVDMAISLVEFQRWGHQLYGYLGEFMTEMVVIDTENRSRSLESNCYLMGKEVSFKHNTFREIHKYFTDLRRFYLIKNSALEYTKTMCLKWEEELIEKGLSKKEAERLLHNFRRACEEINGYSTLSYTNPEASGDNGVYFCATTATHVLSRVDYINDSNCKKDLHEYLLEGKILIIAGDSIIPDIISSLLSTCLGKLSATIKFPKRNRQKISLIVDEASRVVDENTDIHTDILRETKTEVNLIGQSEAQFIGIFGNVKWLSWKDNFNHRIQFNKEFSPDLTTPFYYKTNQAKTDRATPLFLDDALLFEADNCYQRKDSRLAKLIGSNSVVIYQEDRYALHNEVCVYDFKREMFKDVKLGVGRSRSGVRVVGKFT